MKIFLRCLLVALLISWTRVYAGETHHNYAVWEPEISAFERSDATNPPAKGGYEFVGSSTIRMWKTLAQDFAGKPVFNRGFGGSEVADSTHFADRIIFPYAPSRIYFRAGGNDLANGKSPEEVFTNFQAFAELVHSKLPATTIYYIAWNPTPSRWKQHEAEQALNSKVASLVADHPYLKYIETSDLPMDASGHPRPDVFLKDQLHFNAEGYRLLAERVRPFVLEPDPSK